MCAAGRNSLGIFLKCYFSNGWRGTILDSLLGFNCKRNCFSETLADERHNSNHFKKRLRKMARLSIGDGGAHSDSMKCSTLLDDLNGRTHIRYSNTIVIYDSYMIAPNDATLNQWLFQVCPMMHHRWPDDDMVNKRVRFLFHTTAFKRGGERRLF